MPYLTGDSLPAETVCGRLLIPNEVQVIANINGALLELTNPDNWEAFGATSVDDTVAAMKAMIEAFFDDDCSGESVVALPTGAIIEFAGAAAPLDYLLCDGSEVGRVAYADLFAVIGETYGAGDESTTFALPDLRRRNPVGVGGDWSLGDTGGEETHVLITTELAAHTHTGPSHTHVGGSHDHAFNHGHDIIPASGSGSVRRLNVQANTGAGAAVSTEGTLLSTGDASANNTGAGGTGAGGSAGSGTAHNNMPPFIALNYIIKT